MIESVIAGPDLRAWVEPVVVALLGATDVDPTDLMLVGAAARDALHAALGHGDLPLRGTSDVDVAVALPAPDDYRRLTERFRRLGSTGIRYEIAGVPTDVMPFGSIEDPTGKASVHGGRDEAIDVWGMREVHAGAACLVLGNGVSIAIPSPAGYTALKLAAWMDRAPHGQDKDADDLAVAMYWYTRSAQVEDSLYAHRQQLLLHHDLDVPVASAAALGADVASLLGPARASDLRRRWAAEIRLPELVRAVTAAQRRYRLGSRTDAERPRLQVLALGSGLRSDASDQSPSANR